MSVVLNRDCCTRDAMEVDGVKRLGTNYLYLAGSAGVEVELHHRSVHGSSTAQNGTESTSHTSSRVATCGACAGLGRILFGQLFNVFFSSLSNLLHSSTIDTIAKWHPTPNLNSPQIVAPSTKIKLIICSAKLSSAYLASLLCLNLAILCRTQSAHKSPAPSSLQTTGRN